MLKFAKFVGVMVVLWIAIGIVFPPTYSATTSLSGTESILGAQLVSCTWCSRSNEYGRRVVLSSPGKRDIKMELEFDTGGYKRAELYELPRKRFLLKGHHEFLEINPKEHSIREISRPPDGGFYLGVFDYDRALSKWRFFQASESAAEFNCADYRLVSHVAWGSPGVSDHRCSPDTP